MKSKALRQRIVDAYPGGGVLKKSCMNIRDGAGAFDHFLEGKGYGTVLEIGTYHGVSAAVLSQFCDKVITIDLLHGNIERDKEVWDRKAFWAGLGINNIELVLVKDDAEKAKAIALMEFDFAFVDGAHDERVAFDYHQVKRCDNVLFHDMSDTPGKDYVSKFVASLPQYEVEYFDIYAMWKRSGRLGATPLPGGV